MPPLLSLNIAAASHDFEIKLYDCPETIRTFIASLISSRYLPKSQSFVAHLSEFQFLKAYLDEVKFMERDASEEIMERIVAWNKAADLNFRVKMGEFNLDIRPEYLHSIKTKLYPDQVTGVRYLTSRHRSLLSDAMGLGKSIQAIATFAAWRSLKIAERALVISISGVKPGWEKEVKKHSDCTVTVLPNGQAPILAALEKYKKKPTDFLVIHYEGICQLTKSAVISKVEADHGNSEVIQSLLQCPIDVVFADEAHLLKNMDTKRYKCFSYLMSHLRTSQNQVEVEYETDNGERFKRTMTDAASFHLEIGEEVDVL